MKRIKLSIVFLLFVISSLYRVEGIYGYMTARTDTTVNQFSIQDKTSYTVIHELMNLDGSTYTLYSRTDFTDVPIGTTVSPEVLSFTGFDSPVQQTVTLNSFSNTVIRYRYVRQQYTLTITNSGLVTTSTPSGTYYYGQEIHLVADEFDGVGNTFIRWTNNTYDRNYTFVMTNDVTIGPIYSISYTVSFEPNNGDAQTSTSVIQYQSIGSLPNVINESCSGTTGSYSERGCTEVYEFKGWYKEPNFITQVNENFVPVENTTLYAKWNKVYYGNTGPEVFDGTNYIDTGVQLFSEENADRDFLVTFTVDANNGYPADRGTIFTNMNEKNEPYPGVHFFYQNGLYYMNVNVLGSKVKWDDTGYVTGQKVTIKRENGIIYYSYDDGPFIYINDLSSFDQYFDISATFGAGINSSKQPYRYFKGTLSDLSVQLSDPNTYTIRYDANGGSGMMIDQSVKVGKTVDLSNNAYVLDDYKFVGWNTEPDGSGVGYSDHQSVSGLGNVGDVVTLYAQWAPIVHYYVHFEPNGGTGTMNDQQFTYDDSPVALTQNTFSKDGYKFMGWNTEPDGSGTSYEDAQLIQNLTDIPDTVITLYAHFMKIAYNYSGDKTFDGTVNDFIDTGVNLYSQTTMDKDFEIRFTVKEVAPDVLNQTQPSIISCKDESNPKWPGFNVRFNNSATTMVPAHKWNDANASTSLPGISTNKLPVEMVFKREDKIVYFSYSYSGFQSQVYTLYEQSSWELTQYFTDNVSFGGIYNSTHTPDRFFKGTLSDMIILIDDN